MVGRAYQGPKHRACMEMDEVGDGQDDLPPGGRRGEPAASGLGSLSGGPLWRAAGLPNEAPECQHRPLRSPGSRGLAWPATSLAREAGQQPSDVQRLDLGSQLSPPAAPRSEGENKHFTTSWK